MDLSALDRARLTDVTWVAFDTEATGYSNVAGRLVEIAGVRFRLLPGAADPAGDKLAPAELTGTFAELVNPGVPMPLEVVAIHGITDADVAAAASPVDVVTRFLAFVGDGVLLAHYAPFDLGAMTFALLRAGKGVPGTAAIDTSILPKRLFPGAPNYALPTLVQFLGLPTVRAHRALPDAHSTMDLFRRSVAAMGPAETLTVADVVKLAGPVLTFEQFSHIPFSLPPDLTVIEEAIARETDLTLEYRGGSKGQGPRRVTPSHLFARDGALFLEGFCHLDQAPKSFRVDRIEQASLVPVDPAALVLRNKGSGHWVKEARGARAR
jgi:DNA polymerase-3 subunit epsilon